MMLVFFIVSAELVGLASSLFTVNSIPTWYAHLARPVFSPPDWVFGPVWILLYALMGLAAWYVWKAKGKNRLWHSAMRLYWLQLIFNFLWSIVFFGQRNIGLALVDIVALWLVLVAVVIVFWKISSKAGWLMVPYIAWVSFALVLNASLFNLNQHPGRPYVEPPKNDIVNDVVFICSANKSVRAVFHTTNKVDLTLSDGRAMTLPQAISASGARYANADESFVFWNKGDTAFIQEKGKTTYDGCAIK